MNNYFKDLVFTSAYCAKHLRAKVGKMDNGEFYKMCSVGGSMKKLGKNVVCEIIIVRNGKEV